MTADNSPPSMKAYAMRILKLKCPRCGCGQLFSSWIRMNESCSSCELDLVREPGFYLGSIYFNYGMTVALVAPTFVILTLGLGYSRDAVLWPSALFSIVFPLWFFRYARTMWLSIMFRVSSVDFIRQSNRPVAALRPDSEVAGKNETQSSNAGIEPSLN